MEDLTRLRETIDNNVMPHRSEFNTALRFPYIGHDIDCLTFQQNTITTTIAELCLSLPHALSFSLSFSNMFLHAYSALSYSVPPLTPRATVAQSQ